MKNMKFFGKCILALFPLLAVVIYTALFPFGYMDSEYPSWKYTKEVSKNVSSVSGVTSSDITLILGDSRAMADLVPSEMDSQTLNLGVGGATSIEMYYTLNSYIKNNGCPQNVIIMFAPFHYSIIDNFWTRTAYFNYLSVNDMVDLYKTAEATGSETLLVKGYKNDLLSYRLRFPDKYLPALMNSKGIGRLSENKTVYENAVSNFGYGEFGTLDGCSDLNYETNYDKMHTTDDALLIQIYVEKLLKLCSDNNISTELMIPPMNEASYNALKPSYVESLDSYFSDLSIKYPKIKINKNIPCYDNKYFGDSSHLNYDGAVKFTHEYIESAK